VILVREHRGSPFYEAFWRLNGKQVKRRIGPAWLERDPDSGGWGRRRGRVPDGSYDERGAHVEAARLVDEYVADAADRERIEHERRTRGVTFREVAHSYMRWLADVAGAKPSTLRDRETVLGEAGVPRKRGAGKTLGHVMSALGNRPAAKITTREIDELLATISATGASAATVNKYRSAVSAVFNHGCKPSVLAVAVPAGEPTSAEGRDDGRLGSVVAACDSTGDGSGSCDAQRRPVRRLRDRGTSSRWPCGSAPRLER
jgi:hypothetical protein